MRARFARQRASRSPLGAARAALRERRRDATGAREKSRFEWSDYGALALLVVVGQAALVPLHSRFDVGEVARSVAATELLSADGATGRDTVWVMWFVVAQMAIAFPTRSLVDSLRHDWRVAEDSRYWREVLLPAVAAPCALCLLPAAQYGPLLGGVLVRLGVLAFAWSATRRGEHRAHESAFLTWAPGRSASKPCEASGALGRA